MSVSRKDLYSYVASMFVGVVKGIYKHMPTALSPDDITMDLSCCEWVI